MKRSRVLPGIRGVLAEFRRHLPIGSQLIAATAALTAIASHASANEPARRPLIAPQPGVASPAPSEAVWPKLLPDPKDPAKEPGAQWTAQEVDAARSRCNALLKGMGAIYIPSSPLRAGACGTAAPVELISIGTSPQVALTPPAMVTCDMVAAMERWFKEDVQPAARALLGGPIVRINIMSHYSCRNAYGRRSTKLSEHGRANALDIRNFETARGPGAELLADWGPTERDVRAQIAAAKAAAAKREADAAAMRASEQAAKRAAKVQVESRSTDTAGTKSASSPSGVPAPVGIQREAAATGDDSPSLRMRTFSPSLPGVLLTNPALAPPSKLGGPKREKKAVAPPAEPTAANRQTFLRRIHASGCRIFGTILGPEANEAHRDHFHVDMAERRNGNFCE